MNEFNKSGDIKYFPISKTDLKDLEEIIVDNNSSDKYFAIYTIINILKISENSIGALLGHKEIPDRLSQYDIKSIKLDSNHVAEKYINMHIMNEHVSSLHISGFDEAWVRGKFQQIEEFINDKFDKFNEEQKLAGKFDAPTKNEKDNKTVIPATLKNLDENSN